MIKFVDNSAPAIPLSMEVKSPGGGAAGETLTFQAQAVSLEAPVLAFQWDFGDGTIGDGTDVKHTYTRAGEYQVTVTATGLDSVTNRKTSRSHHNGRNLHSIRTIEKPESRVTFGIPLIGDDGVGCRADRSIDCLQILPSNAVGWQHIDGVAQRP